MDEMTNTYSVNDYESNNGMLVAIWGPSAWHFMHTMSFNYPVNPSIQNKTHYREYILNLVNVLPCGKCRKNLKENFKKLPLKMIHMESRYTFSRYVYDLHELVNNMLGKKSGLSYEQVKERYEHFRARCAASSSTGELLPKMKEKKGVGSERTLSVGSERTLSVGSKRTLSVGSKRTLEKGCTEPLVGEKAKCILKIVPEKQKCKTFTMDKKCVKKKKNNKTTRKKK
jgi:hypothetical protein